MAGMSAQHVFADESERGPYLLGAVAVDPADLKPVRQVLRELRLPRQRRLHMVKERGSRRRHILTTLSHTPIRVRVYQCRAPSTPARRRCLHSLVVDLVDTGAARLVLERHDTQQRADHQLIQHTVDGLGGHLTHVHLRGHEEPLLWAADAVTWAYSAGGDWRRRIDPMLDKAVLLDLP